MRILVIGSGAREHALAWRLTKSPKVEWIYVAPGNAGTAYDHRMSNIKLDPLNFAACRKFVTKNNIDFTVVGPEAPLAAGIVDYFKKHKLPCFGPTQKAAQLESSKQFSKDFMKRHKIPTAKYATFNKVSKALTYCHAAKSYPLVIKADGLAAGKGVVIVDNLSQAEEVIHEMLENQKQGSASQTIIIEEFLPGEEVSFIVATDGKNVIPLVTTQDHKKRDEGDEGPNTGGMGAYSPASIVTPELEQTILDTVIYPTLYGMAQEGIPYQGFLYAGLMISPEGQIKVLEFNCRLGDPEAQAILLRMQSDFAELFELGLQGKLDEYKAEWDPDASIAVVLANLGYPEDYAKNDPIEGLPVEIPMDVPIEPLIAKVFHAGTKLEDSETIASGGRVLSVCALGETITEAATKAYETIENITWPNRYFRRDIGYRAIEREKAQEPKHDSETTLTNNIDRA